MVNTSTAGKRTREEGCEEMERRKGGWKATKKYLKEEGHKEGTEDKIKGRIAVRKDRWAQ